MILTAVVADHIHAVSHALQLSRDSDKIEEILRYTAEIYLRNEPAIETVSLPDEAEKNLIDAHFCLIDASKRGLERACIVSAFWAQPFFLFSETLLYVLNEDLFSHKGISILFYQFFYGAPASRLLQTISQYMARHQPTWEKAQGVRIIPSFGLQKSAEIFCHEFLAPQSRGIPELFQTISKIQEEKSLSREIHKTATELISIPEKAAITQIPELSEVVYPKVFLGSFLSNAINFIPSDSQYNSKRSKQGIQEGDIDDGKMEDETSHTKDEFAKDHSGIEEPLTSEEEFFCAVVLKFVRRGKPNQVIDSFYKFMERPNPDKVDLEADFVNLCTLVLRSCQDPAVSSKFVEALLSRAICTQMSFKQLKILLSRILLDLRVLRSSGMRYLLTESLYLHQMLAPASLDLLTQILAEFSTFSVPQILEQLLQVWHTQEFIDRLSTPRQAYVTASCLLLMDYLDKRKLEGSSNSLRFILQGVSKRLDCAIPSVRMQGMRVGNKMASILDSDKTIFPEAGGLSIASDELWHTECEGTPFGIPNFQEIRDKNNSGLHVEDKLVKNKVNVVANSDLLELEKGFSEEDSDDEVVNEKQESDSDDSIQAYDLNEDDTNGVIMDGGKILQLRDVAEMVRKSDDSKQVIKGLSLISNLIESNPDELVNHTSELVRSLLHCRIPDWKDLREGPQETRPDFQLQRALISLLVLIPRDAGLALSSEIYSPHLDLHQRFLILDCLASAALQMSTSPSQAKNLLNQEANLDKETNKKTSPIFGKEGQSQNIVRANFRSLALQKAPSTKTFRNRFPGVALDWVSNLLRDCKGEKQGVDLFGRDNALLGRLLITLGSFVEAASPSLQMIQISATILELIRANPVHAHPQAYVRRSALLTASKIVSSLPPSILAGAMIGRSGSLEDDLLVQRLEWLQSWLQFSMGSDPDVQVQKMAAACLALQSELANNALECLSEEEFQSHHNKSIGPSTVLGINKPSAKSEKFEILLPKLQNLV